MDRPITLRLPMVTGRAVGPEDPPRPPPRLPPPRISYGPARRQVMMSLSKHLRRKQLEKTPNAQHPTPNVQLKKRGNLPSPRRPPRDRKTLRTEVKRRKSVKQRPRNLPNRRSELQKTLRLLPMQHLQTNRINRLRCSRP